MTSHCRNGHPRTPDNIYVAPKTGIVGCKACRKLASKAARQNGPPKNYAKYDNVYRFGGNRELAIQRDSEKCVMCGMTRQEHREKYGRDITIDHIDNQGRNTPKKNHELNNLQTLCLSCHGRKDSARIIPKYGKQHGRATKVGNHENPR